ncbi:MAG: hypothetical protein WC308_00015 [archaeon]|jgi:hypothetical protein
MPGIATMRVPAAIVGKRKVSAKAAQELRRIRQRKYKDADRAVRRVPSGPKANAAYKDIFTNGRSRSYAVRHYGERFAATIWPKKAR